MVPPEMGCVRGCAGLVLWVVGILPRTGYTQPQVAVSAQVVWAGPCEDGDQLARELRERGIAFVALSHDGSNPAALRLSVETHHEDSESEAEVVANVELSDAFGNRESRRVDVTHCELLHPALALILASFAERQNLGSSSQEPPSAGSAQPEERVLSVPALPDAHARATPRPDELAISAVPRHASTFGELRLGTHTLAGLGWAGAAALGMAVQLEWRPSERWPFWIAGGYVHLPTPVSDESAPDVAWLRGFGRLVGTVGTPIAPLKLSLGAEWGEMQASAPSSANRQTGHAPWYAVTAMPRVDVRLIGNVLFLQALSGLAFAPVRYTLRYADTDRVLVRSSQLEWRAELGLSVRLSSSFP